MIELSLEVKGLKQLQQAFKAERVKQQKALNTAIKVEGYRLREVMQQEIRKGAPGGRSFAPLTVLGARTKASNLRGKADIEEFGRVGTLRRPKKSALQRLATSVRYYIPNKRYNMEMYVGWTGPHISKSWKHLAKIHQEGFTRAISRRQRRFFMHRGQELSKRSRYRKYFFLRKSTSVFRTPPRPIIDPFWRAHEEEAWRNIRNNYKRKLRGERI